MKRAIWVCSLALSSTLAAQQYTISTIAGGGILPSPVPAMGLRVPVSDGVVTGSGGDVYFTSGNSVLKIDAKGILTRVAGSGKYGYSGDGGAAANAQLAWPGGLVLDASGNLFIADNANHRVRKVTPAGIISTFAGGASEGNSGDDGPASSAQLSWPSALALDASGNLYITDTGNHSVRRVSSSGTISTVAAGLNRAEGVAIDKSGNLFIADHKVITGDEGELYYTARILRMAPGGAAETFAERESYWYEGTGLLSPRGIAVDAAGILYVSDRAAGTVWRVSLTGEVTAAAKRNFSTGPCFCPRGIALDGLGNLYVADDGHIRIAKISPQGDLTNLVGDESPGNYWGDGGAATGAALQLPLGVAVDSSANLYIADTGNSRVRKVAPDGVITTVAGTGTSGFSGDGGPATSAQLRGPSGLAVDSSGNLYIADYLDHRIRKVSPSGIITTIAGTGATGSGIGPWGDEGPATGGLLAGPLGVAVDASGNVYIADTFHLTVRKVSTAGIITTVAGRAGPPFNSVSEGGKATDAQIGFPTGVTVDAAGSLYFATRGRVRKVSPSGIITTAAGNGADEFLGTTGDGGPATNAALPGTIGVALDAAGNLYISGGDLSGGYVTYLHDASRVRKVGADGMIATIAGNGKQGYSGDGGLATAASFASATVGIAVDAGGTVYVADPYNNVIRALRVDAGVK